MTLKPGTTVDLCVAYMHMLDGLVFDARSQWLGRGRNKVSVELSRHHKASNKRVPLNSASHDLDFENIYMD